MPTAATSLIVETPQVIAPDVWTVLRFNQESSDAPGWHDTNDINDPASALIVPNVEEWADIHVMIHWASASGMGQPPTQYMAQLARDPYSAQPNTTATNDKAPTPGKQFQVFSWGMKVFPGMPVAVRVQHDGSAPLAVVLAEFKVIVH